MVCRSPARMSVAPSLSTVSGPGLIRFTLSGSMMETIEALFAERGAEDRVWGSMVKQALKRQKPGFNESYYGFRSFGKLLEEAQARKLITLGPEAQLTGNMETDIANIRAYYRQFTGRNPENQSP